MNRKASKIISMLLAGALMLCLMPSVDTEAANILISPAPSGVRLPIERQLDFTETLDRAQMYATKALRLLWQNEIKEEEIPDLLLYLNRAVAAQKELNELLNEKDYIGLQDVRDIEADWIGAAGPQIETLSNLIADPADPAYKKRLTTPTVVDGALDRYYHIELEDLTEEFLEGCFELEDSFRAALDLIEKGEANGVYTISDNELEKINKFFAQKDEKGVTNLAKTAKANVIKRLPTTSTSQSYESGEMTASDYPVGVYVENGRLIGFGIHILNDDVYPLQYFEVSGRGMDLVGNLDLSGCADIRYIDVYNNRISGVNVTGMTDLRILGVQNNRITAIDPTTLVNLQGIDAGLNRLTSIDVSKNPDLVELYVNDNQLTEIDISNNQKLKYFYCHNNKITTLDTTQNPYLRHLNASGCPMTSIRSLAPQREERLPLEVYAEGGGTVGLMYYPVYDAQWKETGEWAQSYHAYPNDDYAFVGWYENGKLVSEQTTWVDTYGTSRILVAKFIKKK